MTRRPLLALTGCATLVLLITGCTPPWTGITGIARTSDGALSGVISMCKGAVEGLTVYFNDDSTDRSQTIGDWEFDAPITETGSVPLTPDLERRMEDGVTYTAYSWSHDASATARGAQFTLRDLVALKPGEVLGNDYRSDAPGAVAMSAEEFEESARAFCED